MDQPLPPSFPLNCRTRPAQRAPTPRILPGTTSRASYNAGAMAEHNTVVQLASRVDRLLLRHEELQRTNELLAGQVHTLTAERDLLRSKLAAARSRIDALLDRIPVSTEASLPPAPPAAPAP